jgi:competence protein ComEC
LLFAALLMLSPSALRLRSFGFALCALMFSLGAVQPKREQLDITLLDVGQGLSIVIQQERSLIVYDLGAKFSDSFSIARNVLDPYISNLDRSQVDAIIVSHSDNDHAGDLEYFVEQHRHEGLDVYLGEPEKHTTIDAKGCHAGVDLSSLSSLPGLTLEFLSPLSSENHYAKANNRSCVLLISYQANKILLTGDIERKVELDLLSNPRLPQNIDLLVAAHHGSATSSTAMLISELRPKHVVHSAGFHNRYRHPSDEVVRRFRNLGSRQWNTAYHGALSFSFAEGKVGVRAERCDRSRRWFDRSNCGFGSFSDSHLGYD